jgi:hypothetical protein
MVSTRNNASACHVAGQIFSCTLQSRVIQCQPSDTVMRYSTATAHGICHLPRGTNTSRPFIPPAVSKLKNVAAMSELFKHRDLDVTLVVHVTERKMTTDIILMALHHSYPRCNLSDNHDMHRIQPDDGLSAETCSWLFIFNIIIK